MKDPLTCWEDGFPYDLLSVAGITPGSTQADVQDATFTLIKKGLMTPLHQRASDALRLIPRRLLIDFFLHPDPTEPPAAPAQPELPIELLLQAIDEAHQ